MRVAHCPGTEKGWEAQTTSYQGKLSESRKMIRI